MEVGNFQIASNCIKHVFILYTYTQNITVSPEASLRPATIKKDIFTITLTWLEKNRHISKRVFVYTR